MNVQNAKSLEIEEGDVKTIHDKDGKLLWGAVGYDTKYAGDTFQQTYSGKNLYDATTAESTFDGLTCSADNAQVYFNGQRGSAWGGNLKNMSLKAGTYKLMLQLVNGSITDNIDGLLTYFQGDNITTSPSYGYIKTGEKEKMTMTVTVSADTTNAHILFYVRTQNVFNNAVIKYQLVSGSTEDWNFEPYVGGTASPNPDYPQDVQTVTGEQTVSITDGTNTQNFTIDLGSTELAKIGTYQDYIYKSGDGWYVHKEVNKTKLDGSGWVLGLAGYPVYYTTSITDYATSNNIPFCAIFSGATNVAGVYGARDLPNNSCAFINVSGDTTPRFYINSSKFANASELNTFLANNDTYIYYALGTPTDTKITDSTLIGELEAVHEWMTRYGYQASVTGNLPMIIRQDALT